jgi:hypothetical protein
MKVMNSVAFSSSIIRKFWAANQYIVIGTFSCIAPATGGDIDTSLRTCRGISLQHIGSSPVPNSPVVNETMPCDGRAVTIACDTDTSGTWIASGEGT